MRLKVAVCAKKRWYGEGASGLQGFRRRWWRAGKRRRRQNGLLAATFSTRLWNTAKRTVFRYSDEIFRAGRSNTSRQNSTTRYRWPSNFVAVCHIKMAPIFASPDIASIVAAFPPPEPTKGQASLVRSTSGEKLYNSQKVLARFESLLEASKDRIPISNLASILGIRDSDWLLAPY